MRSLPKIHGAGFTFSGKRHSCLEPRADLLRSPPLGREVLPGGAGTKGFDLTGETTSHFKSFFTPESSRESPGVSLPKGHSPNSHSRDLWGLVCYRAS